MVSPQDLGLFPFQMALYIQYKWGVDPNYLQSHGTILQLLGISLPRFPEVCLWDSRNFSGPEVKLEEPSPLGEKGEGVVRGLDGVWVACWVEVLGLAGHFLY